MKFPNIFIATPDSKEYLNLIRGLLGSQIEVTLASSLQETTKYYKEETVVLGRPDYVSVLLEDERPIKWVQSTWAGVTPLIKMPNKSYALTCVKDVFSSQISEYIIGHILSFELKIQERLLSQQSNKWDPVSSGQMSGKTAGIMGTGSIGSALATALTQLGVEVHGFNSSGKQTLPFKKVYSKNLINEFLAGSDYLIGVLPDLSTTTDLINASTLKELKETALFINVGRGNLVDEAALSASLRSKELAGAVLDVTKKEPLPVDSELWAVPNLTLTAHTAAESRPKDIVGLFLRNLNHFVKSEPLECLVDFKKGY